jgi:hypothetical protein
VLSFIKRRISTVNRARTLGLPLPASAIMGLMIVALGLVACNGSAPLSPAGTLPATARSGVAPATKPSPTPYTFDFATLNNPASSTFNCVMGVNNLNHVVGYYGSGTQDDPSHGFNSTLPYTKFRGMNYPDAVSTVATSLSSISEIFAGYFVDNSAGHHTWGFIRNKGIWSQYKDYKTPKGPNSVNELLGVSDSDVAVGFYTDSYGHDVPYELVDGRYHALQPPGAVSAMATGINKIGDITGTVTLTSQVTEGWILRNGFYSEFSYPGSSSTQASAVNYEDQVVGSYVDGQGTHGFILDRPASPTEMFWQSIDEPKAAGTTVITSINSHHTISGCYVDASGNTDGFVATVK